MPHLLLAHPGHELLLHGWISRTKPVVHILTGGVRLDDTAKLLADLGARRGAIFGRLSDAESYAMILERDSAMLLSLVAALAAELETQRPAILVCDAAEGYNPVHDLCRIIAGAAIATAGVETKLYEYAVVNHPRSLDGDVTLELDPVEWAAKLGEARGRAPGLADVHELLSRYGGDAYRREALHRVDDWTAIEHDASPLYEQYGEQRVAAGRYARVIREREHMLPLLDSLRAKVERRSCAF